MDTSTLGHVELGIEPDNLHAPMWPVPYAGLNQITSSKKDTPKNPNKSLQGTHTNPYIQNTFFFFF